VEQRRLRAAALSEPWRNGPPTVDRKGRRSNAPHPLLDGRTGQTHARSQRLAKRQPATRSVDRPFAIEKGGSRGGLPQSPAGEEQLARYFEPLCGFFRRQWRFSLEDAQDLTQETSLRACQNLHRLAAGEKLEAWLFAIARNLARSHYRRQRGRPLSESPDALEADGAALAAEAEGPAEACQRQALVAESLRQVRAKNPKAAAVIYYREGERLPYQEIARLVGETPDNCRQLHRRYLPLFRRSGRE